MHKLIPSERQKDTVILAVSPDPPAKMVDIIPKVKDKTGREFVVRLLSDANHAVIDRYGLLNEAAAARGRFLPHPTTYVIDREGIVRWKFTEVDYKIRPTNERVLEGLRQTWR